MTTMSSFWFQSNSLGSGNLVDKWTLDLVQKSTSMLPAINNLHNANDKATVNKANQTANTPEESGKHPRNETPKRHIIARINVK